MRSIGKRLGAIFLCMLMVLTSIGVQPLDVSAEAGSGYSYGNFGSGTTDVVVDIGVRFLLVNYNKYQAWQSVKNKAVDLRTTNKSKLQMKNNIKSGTYLRHLNCSAKAIYVGYGGEIGCAYGAYTKAGLKSVKSYSWNSIGKVIKYMTGSSTPVVNAWTSLKDNRTSPDKWISAFNKLEARLLKVSYDDSQGYLKRAFKAYNAISDKNDGYTANNGYYLMVEPIAYVKRGSGVVAVSAQDMYSKFSTDDKSLLGTYLKGVVSGEKGITLGAGGADPLRNLSQLLYQKNFAYPDKKKPIKASGSASVISHSYQNNWKFYTRGGYACIVPKKASGHTDGTYQVYHTAVYDGSVGDNGGSLKDSSSKVVTKNASITNSYDADNDYYALNVGNYVLSAVDESQTVASLKTAVSAINGNYGSNPFKINWATDGRYSLDLGTTWGTSAGSTFSSNGHDYVVNSIGNVTTYAFNSAIDESDGNDLNNVVEEDATDNVADDNNADNQGGEGGGDNYTPTSTLGDGDTTDDNPDPDTSDDTSAVDDLDKTTNDEKKLTYLSQSFDKYGYVNTVGNYIVNSASIKSTLKNSFKNAYTGLYTYNSVPASKDYINAEWDSSINNPTDAQKAVVDDIPYTSSVLVKKSTIKSYGYQITYDAENNSLSKSVAETSGGTSVGSGSVTYKTFNGSASSKNYGSIEGDKNAFYVVAVPNSSPVNGTAFRDAIYNRLVSNSAEEFLSNMDSVMSDSFALSKEVEGGDKVTVGACQNSDGSGLTGYTVVFIGIKGDIPLTGEEVLESYQLNNIDSDIASNFADQHHNSSLIFKSRKSSTYNYNDYNSTTKCTYCNTSWDTVSSRTKSYDIVYKDASEGEHTVANDNNDVNNNRLGKYLLKTTINGGNIADRLTLRSGETVNTGVETKKFTYAFNLVRTLFENKTASSITANNGISTDVTEVLKMTYGNVPAGITNIDEKRNPNAFVGGTLVESLKWTGTYEDTTEHHASGKYRLAKPKNAFKHTCYTTDANGNQVQHDLAVQYECKKWSESIKPFKLNKIPMENAKIIVTEKAHKYQTAEMATGKNENQDGIIPSVSSMNGVDVNYDSVLDDDTRYAYLERHNVTGDNIDIYFYPEVKMMMYGMVSGVDSISDDSSVYKKALYTMGEQRRTVQSSSLYLYRISSRKTAEGVGQALTGKIYSDDMTTNSAGKGDAPVIYAGGNVSLKVDGANMNLNLYGYAVDLVNKSKDGSGFKINDSETLTYKSIVDDESDIYANWGNAPESVAEANRSTQKLFTDYKAWVSNMADSNKYGADVTLQVTDTTKADGKKEYNNFSTTIGKVVTESGTVVGEASKEEGVYPIAVYNGKVVTSKDSAEELALSKGYWSLVAQVQKDYNCDETTAIKVLEDSGMFDAIYRAIESSTSKFNKSGKADSGISDAVTNEDTALLGSGDNWYDEVVKTFCIRRYVTETLHFDGTVLSDKIDYDAAPKDNSVSSGINDKQSAYNKSNAKWYISFYFKGNPNDGVVGSLTEESKKMYHSVGDYEPKFYNPAETSSSDSFGKAKNTFTVLTEKLHIDGADFIIPSSATSDESN